MIDEAASAPTLESNRRFAAGLPDEDGQDFRDAARGLIASLEPPIISTGSGAAAWNLETYDFLSGDAPGTVNPSLWRMAKLGRHHGLFRVADDVYQVRGYDSSNMTVVIGRQGFVVIDPLTVVETARAAMQLVRAHLGDRPVSAVVYTHCHRDHFGGVEGVVTADEVVARGIPVVAPAGFMDEVVSESVFAGNIMARRAQYLGGSALPLGVRGQVSAGIGLAAPRGTASLIAPTTLIEATPTDLELDGIRFRFQYAPDSEAPAELTFHLPDHRTLCLAEIVSHTMHNLYTLRGARVRDALAWARHLTEAIELFGSETDVLINSHHWPVWGNDRIRDFVASQRDLYKYIHDQTLRLANHGYTMVEIAEMLTLPEPLARRWANRGLYGTLNHNVKAVYQRYLGWFDGNPANLHTLPPRELGRRYVDALGGIDGVLQTASRAAGTGDYRWAAELLKHAIAAHPDDQRVRNLQATVLEQLGYQSESAQWRNFYLSGAYELRQAAGRPEAGRAPIDMSDLTSALTTRMLLDYLAIRLNGPRAAHLEVTLALNVSDSGEQFAVSVRNGVLTYVEGKQLTAADVVVRTSRSALRELSEGRRSLDDAVARGDVRVEGDLAPVRVLLTMLDTFERNLSLVTPN